MKVLAYIIAIGLYILIGYGFYKMVKSLIEEHKAIMKMGDDLEEIKSAIKNHD